MIARVATNLKNNIFLFFANGVSLRAIFGWCPVHMCWYRHVFSCCALVDPPPPVLVFLCGVHVKEVYNRSLDICNRCAYSLLKWCGFSPPVQKAAALGFFGSVIISFGRVFVLVFMYVGYSVLRFVRDTYTLRPRASVPGRRATPRLRMPLTHQSFGRHAPTNGLPCPNRLQVLWVTFVEPKYTQKACCTKRHSISVRCVQRNTHNKTPENKEPTTPTNRDC